MTPRVQKPTARQLRFVLYLSLYLALFTLAELFTISQWTAYGLIVHLFLLMTLLMQASFSETPRAELLTAMIALPLIRLLSYGIPAQFSDEVYFLPLVNLPLIVATIMIARVLHYSPGQVGIIVPKEGLGVQALIACSGFIIGWLERFFIQPPALTAQLSLGDILISVFVLLVFTGLSEELLFRGVLQRAAMTSLGNRGAIVFISLLFGVLHIGWQSFADVVFVTIVGLFFAFCVVQTRSIIGVSLAHGLANIMLFVVLPSF